jgi:hypothetical protein
MSLVARIIVGSITLLIGVMMIFIAPDDENRPFSHVFGAFCAAIGIAYFTTGRVRAFFGSLVCVCVVAAGLSYLGSTVASGTWFSGSRSSPSVLNAVFLNLVFGVPAALYLWKWGFGLRTASTSDSATPAAYPPPWPGPTKDMAAGREARVFRFRSAMFSIDPREDEETNPFLYGRALANWLRGKLAALGYTPEDVIAEDYGWIVILNSGAGMLWVGCVNDHHHLYAEVSPENKDAFVPDAAPVVWNVWVAVDNPMWSLNVGKRRAAIRRLQEDASQLAGQLLAVLQSEPGIEFLPQD